MKGALTARAFPTGPHSSTVTVSLPIPDPRRRSRDERQDPGPLPVRRPARQGRRGWIGPWGRWAEARGRDTRPAPRNRTAGRIRRHRASAPTSRVGSGMGAAAAGIVLDPRRRPEHGAHCPKFGAVGAVPGTANPPGPGDLPRPDSTRREFHEPQAHRRAPAGRLHPGGVVPGRLRRRRPRRPVADSHDAAACLCQRSLGRAAALQHGYLRGQRAPDHHRRHHHLRRHQRDGHPRGLRVDPSRPRGPVPGRLRRGERGPPDRQPVERLPPRLVTGRRPDRLRERPRSGQATGTSGSSTPTAPTSGSSPTIRPRTPSPPSAATASG